MIIADFTVRGNLFLSFSVSGHSEYDDFGLDIVCAGVSSAVMLTINTIDEFLKINCITQIKDNIINFKITETNKAATKTASCLVESLYCHLRQMQEDYTENIKVKITEVQYHD